MCNLKQNWAYYREKGLFKHCCCFAQPRVVLFCTYLAAEGLSIRPVAIICDLNVPKCMLKAGSPVCGGSNFRWGLGRVPLKGLLMCCGLPVSPVCFLSSMREATISTHPSTMMFNFTVDQSNGARWQRTAILEYMKLETNFSFSIHWFISGICYSCRKLAASPEFYNTENGVLTLRKWVELSISSAKHAGDQQELNCVRGRTFDKNG